MMRDSHGHPLTGASADSVEDYQQALRELRCFTDDPVASVDRALAASPDFVMARVLRAYLHLLGTEPHGFAIAREELGIADGLSADDREHGHRLAARALVESRWHDAGRHLEDVALEHPHDLLALQVGHQVDFFTGRSRMLRDRIARALPHWDPAMPGYHALLGMHAFGLEECGSYAEAERRGRRAVEMEPRDGWAWHAVAHAMEMEDRRADGIAWFLSDVDAWSRDSFFAVHNWWHLALFHLDRGEVDAALALYDGPIGGGRSRAVMDLVDASSLLWRLTLLGVDVRRRWQILADGWAPIAGAGTYAFNDVHAMMAFVGAGRSDGARAIFEAQTRAMSRDDDNAEFTREIGAPVVNAIYAFGQEAYAAATELLRPVREIASRFGGSHAQRDVLDRTLVEAARRSRQHALVRGLESERRALRPLTGAGPGQWVPESPRRPAVAARRPEALMEA